MRLIGPERLFSGAAPGVATRAAWPSSRAHAGSNPHTTSIVTASRTCRSVVASELHYRDVSVRLNFRLCSYPRLPKHFASFRVSRIQNLDPCASQSRGPGQSFQADRKHATLETTQSRLGHRRREVLLHHPHDSGASEPSNRAFVRFTWGAEDQPHSRHEASCESTGTYTTYISTLPAATRGLCFRPRWDSHNGLSHLCANPI